MDEHYRRAHAMILIVERDGVRVFDTYSYASHNAPFPVDEAHRRSR